MSRGFGKYRRGASHHSFHFDTLFKENSNRPSAARSAASVGKWGITSFTSIRTLNGRQENEASTPESAPKPKKFFKSRDSNQDAPAYTPPTNFGGSPPKKTRSNSYDSSERRPRGGASKKFFSSKNQEKAAVLSQKRRNSDRSDTSDASKPPIVLRICRGKSQLVNDTDESERSPSPTSSASSSPRALRETSSNSNSGQQTTPPRPSNCRITRSARRSMQMDPSSPSSADTPVELTMTSKKEPTGFSPQYVPAEKFEEERRALYASLLKPDSPKLEEKNTPVQEQEEVVKEEQVEQEEEEEEFTQVKVEEEEPKEEEEQKVIETELVPQEPEPIEEKVEDKSIEEALAELHGGEEEEEEEDEETYDKDEDVGLEIDMDVEPEELKQPESEETIENIAKEIEKIKKEEKRTLRKRNYEEPEIDKHRDEILDKILQPPVPPVKLVISKKKGSIFKSRALIEDGGSKSRRARYVHKWTEDGKAGSETPVRPPEEETMDDAGFDFEDQPLTRIVKLKEDQEISSVRCMSKDKQYYMVVRNVKKSHQIQEIGEFQEFNDDVEYILDALQDNNSVSTRCLSAITLASKCMAPAFRMHVRAHGTVGKFFKALHDACRDASLGLCTATVMFVLSQDRLNMDLDRDCLELMLNLLESDVSYQQALDVCGLSKTQLEKNKDKVRELCAEIQSKGHAMHLNLENITTGQLAMETLLSLTSKRAGEWFKEELRELGGLEHIMKTIHECCRQVSDYVVSWTDALLDKLKKVDRCLRVLENVTQNNEENQTYILKYNDGMIIDTLVSLYKLCDGEIPLYPVTDITDKSSTGTIIREALLVTLKVLINLTHHYRQQSIGSQLIGSRSGIIETSLHLLLQVPNYIPEQKKFELGVLVLMLLINLIQDQEANKPLLMEAKAPSKLESIYSREESAVEALIVQFYEWEGCAKIAENKTNAILDGEKDEQEQECEVQPQQPKSNEEFIEETVAKLLQKAGTHMEYTFLASYIVMLLGFLIMENEPYQTSIRQFLRGNNFADMVELLKKFYNFMNLTASTEASSVCAVKATQKVIKFLESCDQADVTVSDLTSEPLDMVVPYL